MREYIEPVEIPKTKRSLHWAPVRRPDERLW
jgi:hypothetical protein